MAVQIGSGYGSMLYNPMEMLKTRASAKTQSANGASAPDAGLSAAERSVLAQESALKASASGADTTTTYKYEIGPDGRKYIVGAEVSITGTEDQLGAVPGGKRQIDGNSAGADAGTATDKDSTTDEKEATATTEESPEVRAAVAELKSVEREVIAHEGAHMAVGGQFAGGVSYTYTTGPDGKKYITGGEVPISTPATDDPEEALRNAEQVMRAAMAPASPSGQDAAVAAGAAQMAAQARAQLAAEGANKGDSGSDGTNSEKSVDAYTAKRAMDAYAATSSKHGLWIAENSDEDRFISTAAA